MGSLVFSFPKHRYEYMLGQWDHIRIIVTGRKIDLNVNLQDQTVELAERKDADTSDLQRCDKYIKAIILGFSLSVARTLLYRDNVRVGILYMADLKLDLHKYKEYNHKCIYKKINGRKFEIEESTNTNIIIADNVKVFILGSVGCIKDAKHFIHQLVSSGLTK